jgi:hypothetical protein
MERVVKRKGKVVSFHFACFGKGKSRTIEPNDWPCDTKVLDVAVTLALSQKEWCNRMFQYSAPTATGVVGNGGLRRA